MHLKLKKHKTRTRHLIELVALVIKTDLHYLPTNTLYGTLLSLSEKLDKDNNIRYKFNIQLDVGVDKSFTGTFVDVFAQNVQKLIASGQSIKIIQIGEFKFLAL